MTKKKKIVKKILLLFFNFKKMKKPQIIGLRGDKKINDEILFSNKESHLFSKIELFEYYQKIVKENIEKGITNVFQMKNLTYNEAEDYLQLKSEISEIKE